MENEQPSLSENQGHMTMMKESTRAPASIAPRTSSLKVHNPVHLQIASTGPSLSPRASRNNTRRASFSGLEDSVTSTPHAAALSAATAPAIANTKASSPWMSRLQEPPSLSKNYRSDSFSFGGSQPITDKSKLAGSSSFGGIRGGKSCSSFLTNIFSHHLRMKYEQFNNGALVKQKTRKFSSWVS
jgi:hypothetical protein